MKDFLGREFVVGDTVVYPAMSGRSCYLVQAVVKEFKENGSITLQPDITSWNGTQRSGETKWIDSRTGKGINPIARSGKHIETPAHWKFKPTGESVPMSDVEGDYYKTIRDHQESRGIVIRTEPLHGYRWTRSTPHHNSEDLQENYEYVPSTYKDYVKKVEVGPRPVTLQRTNNIILIEKAGE